MRQTFNEAYNRYMETVKNDHPIMCFHDNTVLVPEFQNRVQEIMEHLVNLGFKCGDGVGYSLPNCYDVIPLFTAIARLGGYAMPLFYGIPSQPKTMMFLNGKVSYVISAGTQAQELDNLAKAQGAKYIVATIDEPTEENTLPSIYGKCTVSVDLFDKIMDNIDPNAPLLMGSSSGTTGIPKYVMMTQQNVGAEMIVVVEMLKESRDLLKLENAYQNVAFPLSTSVILILLGILLCNCTIVFDDDMSPIKYFENIQRHKCNVISGPPAYFEALTMFKGKVPFDVSSIEVVGAGMDFCNESLLKRLKEVFPNLKYYSNGYGLVETSNVFTKHTTDISGDDFGDSTILDVCEDAENQVEIRDAEGNVVPIGETGEVFIKGPNVVNGYLNRPEENEIAFKDGWFKTGDIAQRVGENSLSLKGREKFFIKRGGKQVSPVVVQNQINKVPGVKDSGVVGVPHPLYGEMIWAFVAVKPGETVELRDIKKKCREDLPFYMMPDQVTFIEDIPKKPGVGKVDFLAMKEMAKEELSKMHIMME